MILIGKYALDFVGSGTAWSFKAGSSSFEHNNHSIRHWISLEVLIFYSADSEHAIRFSISFLHFKVSPTNPTKYPRYSDHARIIILHKIDIHRTHITASER